MDLTPPTALQRTREVMLRNHLCSLASLVGPLIAAGLILPPVAMAAPDAPVASETLVTSDSPPPPPQAQQQSKVSESLTPESGKAQNMQFNPGTAPTYHGPGITMQPQIQVQVQPHIQVTAQPYAEANPNSNSNSNSNAKSDIRNTATADADTKSDSQSQSQSSSDSDIKVKQDSSAAPTGTTRTVATNTHPTRIRIKTTIVPGKGKVHPIYPYKKPSRRKGLMIAGWTIFGSSYLPTAFTGAQIYDWCSNNRTGAARKECRELGQLLMIPGAGPFMAIEQADTATEGYALALTGAVQSASLLMALIGTSQFIRDGRRNRRISAQGVRVAKGLRIGAGSLNYRF